MTPSKSDLPFDPAVFLDGHRFGRRFEKYILVATANFEFQFLAGAVTYEQPEILERLYGFALDAHDLVAGLETGLGGRAILFDRADARERFRNADDIEQPGKQDEREQ